MPVFPLAPTTSVILAALLATSACGGLPLIGKATPKPEAPRPETPRDLAPPREGEDLESRRQERLRQRFPGVARLSRVKIVRHPEKTPGPCSADFEVLPGSNTIDLEMTTADGSETFEGATAEDLVAAGWLPAYRTPAGVGIEKKAEFEAIDLTLNETLTCRCFGQDRLEEAYPARLRLRWKKGGLVEISAATTRDGKSSGLTPAITAGGLVTYDFPIRVAFPKRRFGECIGHLVVTLEVDPPLL